MTNPSQTSPVRAGTRHGSAVVTTPSATEILITRVFDSPAALVYRAITTPDLVRRWWAGDRGVVTVCEIDLRVGGAWRYVMTANGGFEVGFHGEYREIVPNERIVSTEVFEGFPDAYSVNIVTLDEVDGVTTLRTLVQHTAAAHRDMHLNSGMEGGMQEAFDHLDDLVRTPA